VKSLVATIVTAVLGAAGTAGFANTNSPEVKEQNAPLLVIGPVESVNSTHTAAIVLGQKILIGAYDQVTVGDTVAVYGKSLPDGSLAAGKIVSEGPYVPGATSIFLTGTVQQVQPSIGRAIVSGLSVDLTSLMAHGAVSPAVGSRLQITGTQPVNNGLVLASGLSVDGISGGGRTASGISGGGLAVNGISGTASAVVVAQRAVSAVVDSPSMELAVVGSTSTASAVAVARRAVSAAAVSPSMASAVVVARRAVSAAVA
jgi:hypothetical protein